MADLAILAIFRAMVWISPWSWDHICESSRGVAAVSPEGQLLAVVGFWLHLAGLIVAGAANLFWCGMFLWSLPQPRNKPVFKKSIQLASPILVGVFFASSGFADFSGLN